MSTQVDLGVKEVARRIHLRLRRYLEAQYHIRDAALIEERLLLLEEPGGISQRPFVEVTPSYAVAGRFADLQIPTPVKDLLEELAAWEPGVGVFPPYRHQADALEQFFAKGTASDDLVIATGTGSGKTETFLYAILGALAIEGLERRPSFQQRGVRALLLYPMNALVSDQTARLRRILGDVRLAMLMRDRWGRHARFGMYTSRTPYPGVRTSNKDARHLDALLGYYERLETSPDPDEAALVAELKARGRWPAKDVVRFFARNLEEKVVIKTGKKAGGERTLHHWRQRFQTQPGDRELLTRHEMHEHAPDLLITNYSMLEYMLLRPIERPIFQQTREWLASDPANQLLLVLDEAHMYRGVGGAEVGLLIRRLLSRLGIGRERLRCILTSASLGTGSEAEPAARDFARGLTGEAEKRGFAIVPGTREHRSGARPGTRSEASALASISPIVLAAAALAPKDASHAIHSVCARLGWPTPQLDGTIDLAVRRQVCRQLTGFGPLELLLEMTSGNATDFAELSHALFPDSEPEEAGRATDGLLALGTFARRTEAGREDQPLLPTRVHLLFRGLPPLYTCIDHACSARRNTSTSALAGRLYTEPRTQCECGARVYELLTHRDCGAAYIRAYAVGPNPEFLWHERGGTLTDYGRPLHELHLLLEEPHPGQRGAVIPMIVDARTGRVLPSTMSGTPGTRMCYRAAEPAEKVVNTSTFGVCPACTGPTQTGGTLKIMDLATKGEQPFANLVREQFVAQSATKALSEQHPNEGRKALLFSDGRQKAARLARDLPREVERDSFREALVLACQELLTLPVPQRPVLDETLYAAFVSVCSRHLLHFFDGHDQKMLLEECARFRRDYDADLDLALADRWRPIPPTRFRTALLRQIGDPYYSLVAACAAVVEVVPAKLRLVCKHLAGLRSDEELSDISHAWLREMLGRSAFDPSLNRDARLDEFGYFQPIRASDGVKRFFDKVRGQANLGPSDVERLRVTLFDVLTREAGTGDDSGRLVANDALFLRIAIDDVWLQCVVCGYLQAKAFLGVCANCGDLRLEGRPPEHPYMIARKGFFREPLRAVLRGERPVHITAEEHTAQLSQRDAGVVYATTEEFELRFQDVPLGPDKPPVDILSCTTTMEVGIDIGSLTAVGLRTVPPQRENYQQRAGRAGRRGTSVSSVLMFAQGGAHDAHYFANPHTIISGPPRAPRIKSDNRRLARRHVNSHLLQTFFHSQLDALSPSELGELAKHRPGIMSTFGDAADFFSDSNRFSFAAFEAWMQGSVLIPKSPIVEEVARWLPTTIVSGGAIEDRRKMVRGIADSLLSNLRSMRDEQGAGSPAAGSESEAVQVDEGKVGGLLDRFFERGLLPSYAFPTDLCSFVIQEWDKTNSNWRINVSERPQLGKAQALSEYAPGRLLVVNKLTYRVGGIFVEGAATSSPAAVLFTQALSRYVGCSRCSFVAIESGSAPVHTTEGSPCAVCGTPLFVREYLDPPAFTPEDGRALREGDREQDITFASTAQLPEIAGRDDFEWINGPGANLRHAYGEDVLLVVANKGKDAAGFSVCQSCGAAWIDGEEPDGAHGRPFLVPRAVLEREGASTKCAGEVRRGLFLVHDFRTDLLLLRGSFRRPLDFSPGLPWLFDALATLAEALALGASLHLDIDAGELSAGFHLLPGLEDGDHGVAELYLFDTASGGAGYAADAGADLEQVLDATHRVLRDCPGRCERSCTKCLRHYGNRFLHSRLDRRLALDLLDFFRLGTHPRVATPARQAHTLRPLARFLELEGWTTTTNELGGLRCVGAGGHTAIVGTHPALLDPEFVDGGTPSTSKSGERHIILPDYLVENDLPSAYQLTIGHGSMPLRQSPGRAQGLGPQSGIPVEFGVRDLRRAGAAAVEGTVRLLADTSQEEGAFAVRVPGDGLRLAGFSPGAWLVVRPFRSTDLGSDAWIVVLRSRGHFAPTAADWTIAHAKTVAADGVPERTQLSYGSATGREFRPERLGRADVTLVATVLSHATQAS